MPKLLFCLMGPTASGKTDLACALCEHLPLEIISVDSAMIYRGMNIGTAKPDASTLAHTPHHLIDILDPIAHYSAAHFCKDVANISQAIFNKGRFPLLVGGTMMYFRALQQGLARLPDKDEGVRARLIRIANKKGWLYLHERLARVDAVSAKKIHSHDTQRIQRALEVYYLTKKPMSSFLEPEPGANAYEFLNLLLMPKDRAWLHERIAQRFEYMLDHGFIEEVQALLQQWPLTSIMPSMRTVGYRQVLPYLDGSYDYDTMKNKGIAATRQLAKRQLTWLRHWPKGHVFDPQNPSTIQEIMAIMKPLLEGDSHV